MIYAISLVAMDDATDAVETKSPSSITRTTSWASLAVEIRQTILSFVCLPNLGKQCNGLGSLKVARFATVSLEWQAFFEARIFRRLVLDPDSVCDFDAIIRRHDARLGYIQKLWLRVRLSTYECPDCDEPENATTQRRNNLIFTSSIQPLLETLKLWDPTRHGAQGIVLMLSASSPSDTKHRLNRCEMKDNYPFHYAEDLNLAGGIVDFHRAHMADPISGLLHRDELSPLSGGYIKRTQGTPLRLEPQNGCRGRFTRPRKNLPAVPMVKGLVMRRQFFRDIHVRTLSWLISRSFVALEWFRLERTISAEHHTQLSFDKGFRLHLLPALPKTLRQLSFTQWEIPISERRYVDRALGTDISQHALIYLPQEMAKLSQRLEQFCPPWQMDTASFLKSMIELSKPPTRIESSLKRLSLRCELLASDRSRQDFEFLITLAAKAALSLPQLEIFELWGACRSGGESCAYIFRYSYEGGRPRMVWRSCGETMRARRRIIAQWSKVAQRRSHPILKYHIASFAETKAQIFRSRGTCIYRHLLLKDLVFDPITQIILENEPYEWMTNEQSNTSHQGETLNSNLAVPNSDLAMQNVEVIAIDAAVDAFFQKYHG